jgi:hypothetical protein
MMLARGFPVIAAVAVVVSAGCGGSAGSSRQETAMSGVAYVSGGPAPGIKQPLANVELRFSLKDRPVTSTLADAHGNYAVKLAPGDYEVQPISAMCPGVIPVTIPSAPTVTADIVCPIP